MSWSQNTRVLRPGIACDSSRDRLRIATCVQGACSTIRRIAQAWLKRLPW